VLRVFRSEWLKLRKSSIWLLILVSPVLAALITMVSGDDAHPWHHALAALALVHGLLLLPLLTGVFAAFVCRFEHAGGGWKQLMSLPISRSSVYLSKFALVMGLLLVMQMLIAVGIVLAGQMKGSPGPIPWETIAKSLIGSWIACLPLAALQMGVSAAWQSFAAPLAVNVIFTLPNILVVNSEKFGPYYPWAQPALAMLPREAEGFGAFNVPLESLFLVILGSFVLFFFLGYVNFLKKAV
jgi:hypothetical protein